MFDDIIVAIERHISYTFEDKSLIKTALTHKSYFREKIRDEQITENYERLEFLGDAILEFVVTDHLYRHYHLAEGVMTTARANLVNRASLTRAAHQLELPQLAIVSEEERRELGVARESIIANIVESIIGAIYLDAGFATAQAFIARAILPFAGEAVNMASDKDPKTLLQETVQQRYKTAPRYRLLDSWGKDHEKEFEVGVYVQDSLVATATAKTKQLAETQAAAQALTLLNSEHLTKQ
jgi:ribonuclease III